MIRSGRRCRPHISPEVPASEFARQPNSSQPVCRCRCSPRYCRVRFYVWLPVLIRLPLCLQGFFGTGMFVESPRKPDPKYSYLRQLEKKQVLSGVEKLKLLSSLENAGLTLSKVPLTHAPGHLVRAPRSLNCQVRIIYHNYICWTLHFKAFAVLGDMVG